MTVPKDRMRGPSRSDDGGDCRGCQRRVMLTRIAASCDTRRRDGAIEHLWGASRQAVADPPDRAQAALAPAPRRHRLLHRPWRLWFCYQGGMGALLRRGWHRPRLGLPADAVGRGHGRQPGTDDGCCAAADRTAALGCLGYLDGRTATALGRFRVGACRAGRQLWGATGLLSPRWCPALPARMVRTGVAVYHAATHRRQVADNARELARHHLPAAARSWCTRCPQQQAGADHTLCVYWS